MLFLALSAFTWHRSGDFLIDFGRELYVPWRISEGAVLYRDIDYLMGPAAAYVNATIFSVVGPSVTALQVSNLIVIAVVGLLLIVHFSDLVRTQTLLLLVSTFLLVFAFSQALGHGIFNFLTPYSHDATYGLVFALIAIVGATRTARRGVSGWALVGGAGLGLAFLTKPELFLAPACACASAFVLGRSHENGGASRRRHPGWSFAAGATAVVAAAVLSFSAKVPLTEALRSAGGAWIHVGDRGVSTSEFYAWVSGVQDLPANVVRMLGWATLFGVVGALAVRADARWGERLGRMRRGWLVVTVPLLVLVSGSFLFISWLNGMTGLPLLVPVGTVYCWCRSRTAGTKESRHRWLAFVVWGVFSEALLLKILLAVRIAPYGFFLAMPATLFLVVFAVEIVPEAVRRRLGHALITSHALAILLVPLFATHLIVGYLSFSRRSYPVGSPPDVIDYWNSPEAPDGLLLNRTLAVIDEVIPPGSSMAVLPEGAGLNFLTRRVNPTSHISLVPPELAAFGERTILQDYKAHKPDYLIVWPRLFREYGYAEFGKDLNYATSIVNWYASEYEPVDSVSARAGGAGRRSLYARFVIYRALDD